MLDERVGSKLMRRHVAMRFALVLIFLLGIPVAGQFPQFPPTRGDRNGQQYPDGSSPADRGPNSPEQRRLKLLNAERQKSLVSDADRLLKLAKELNDEVGATDTGTMTNGQLRKVEEIGKLAKSVKDKMSYSVGGFPNVNQPLTIPPSIQ